jgi:DNA polymerase-3 subunit epsilon
VDKFVDKRNKMREIVLDTETTGLDPLNGHRLTEIGCIELINHVPTGVKYQQYINPERDVPIEAQEKTGLTQEFLKDYPVFSKISQEFMDFIQDDPLVIHNAKFDMKFLNYELQLLGLPSLEKNKIIDTLAIAREKFPGSPASLDALCKRFKIDNTDRTLHGALIDCDLLAKVYLELKGGAQAALIDIPEKKNGANKTVMDYKDKPYREPRKFPISAEEIQQHTDFIKKYILK